MVAFPLSCWVWGGSSCHFKHSAASVKTKTHDTVDKKDICFSLMAARVYYKVMNPTLSVLNFAQQVLKVLLPHFLTREVFFFVHLYGLKYYPLQQEIFPQQKNCQKPCPTTSNTFFANPPNQTLLGLTSTKSLSLLQNLLVYQIHLDHVFFIEINPPRHGGGTGDRGVLWKLTPPFLAVVHDSVVVVHERS